MTDENELDLQTFQVYPDEEPVKTQVDNKSKKSNSAKSIKDKVTANPFSGGKVKKTSSSKKSSSFSFNELLNKITPITACIIGIGIVFVYIAFDILISI